MFPVYREGWEGFLIFLMLCILLGLSCCRLLEENCLWQEKTSILLAVDVDCKRKTAFGRKKTSVLFEVDIDL